MTSTKVLCIVGESVLRFPALPEVETTRVEMDCFIGEIRAFSFNYAPQYWALCNGASLPVNQNQALYALLSNQYGGDQQNFNLPDLRGRAPVHRANATGYLVGNTGGTEQVVLTAATMPQHTHQALATLQGGGTNPTGNYFAGSGVNTKQGGPAASQQNLYGPPSPLVGLSADTVDAIGAGEGHNNMQPFLVVNYCICMSGLWPSRG